MSFYADLDYDTIRSAMQWKILLKKSDNLVEQLLINRGIKTKKQKENFFHPKLPEFEKEFKIPGIEKAIKRIKEAIKNSELIIAYGDYDVDGICGAAVLYLGLTQIGAKVLPYIPHREKEGYGLSKVGLQTVRDQGATLVISIDCGIVNFDEAIFAKELGLDLIITDHHQLGNKKLESFATVHSTSFCGATVAWCLIKDLLGKTKSEELLDLVSVATIADMIPLTGVNRALVKFGLEKLNVTERVGLLALMAEAKISKGEISSYEIGHVIAPRLNAMGRLEHAIDALRLLCTKDSKKAKDLADLISQTNEVRKKLTFDAVESAKLQISKQNKKIYVLSDKDWNSGIVGLVAGRICEETKVPVIAISVGVEYSKGSARSVDGINIVELIRKCEDILVAVGGHPGAAGFTIETTKINEFQTRLEALIGDGLASDAGLEVEAEVKAKELSLNLANQITTLEPFGMGNQKPVLATFGMRLSDLRTVGEGKHLKGKADDIDFIAFSKGDLINILQNGGLVDLAYNLEIDRFNGSEKLQLNVKDMNVI